MNAYYVLRINDVSDPHNHLYSVVYPDNWDQGEGLVAAHAADRGHVLKVFIEEKEYKTWVMRKPGSDEIIAGAAFERLYE